jgi:hypothetical protein
LVGKRRRLTGLAAATVAGVALPHVYWLLVVQGVDLIALFAGSSPLRTGLGLLVAGVVPMGLLVFMAARRRLNFVAATSLGLTAATVAAVLNYYAISWWYLEYFYNA